MAKKGGFLKAAVGLASVAVAGKVAYDKYRNTKQKFIQEEEESSQDEVKKYNAIMESRAVEIQDEEFTGCEIKAIASKMVLDLSLASITSDVYINFKSTASSVIIVLPDGVNAVCDIEKVASAVNDEIDADEDDAELPTAYIIGNANVSSVYVIPASFYVEDENDYEDMEEEDGIEKAVIEETIAVADKTEAAVEKAVEKAEDAAAEVEDKVKKAAAKAEDVVNEEIQLNEVGEDK